MTTLRQVSKLLKSVSPLVLAVVLSFIPMRQAYAALPNIPPPGGMGSTAQTHTETETVSVVAPSSYGSQSSSAVALPTTYNQAPPVSVQPVGPPQQQMTMGQFQQWLQSNGYAKNQPGGNSAGSQPPTSAPVSTVVVPGPGSVVGATTTTTRTQSVTTTGTAVSSGQPIQSNVEGILLQHPSQRPHSLRRYNRFRYNRPLTYEQGQRIMRDSAPRALFPVSQDSNYAFNALLQQNMPMSPRQVVRLHQQIDVAQRAAAIPANIPPKPVSTTVMINLAPGTTPPAVRLAQGYVSSLVFIDSTGTPWPIAAFDIGNPKALNIQWDGKSNILLMQAISPYSDGDIVIRLVGLATPITLELVSGQRVVDYRVDLHVPGIGPNTKELPLGSTLPSSANQLLLGVLDGVAPAGARQLSITGGGDCEVWLLGEKLYLRTRLTLLSPGWIGKMTSPDGMQAYELPKTSSVLVSRYGEPAELRVEGF